MTPEEIAQFSAPFLPRARNTGTRNKRRAPERVPTPTPKRKKSPSAASAQPQRNADGPASDETPSMPPPAKRGRPRITPDARTIRAVERMARLGLTAEQMADVIGVDRGTFARLRKEDLFAAVERGKASGARVSGNALLKQVRRGDVGAIRWYEQTRLGMSDRVHTVTSGPDGGPVQQEVHVSGTVAIGLFLPTNGREVGPMGNSSAVAIVPPPKEP